MREIKFRAWDNTSREIGGQKIISWDELIDLDNNGLLPLAGVLLGESEDLILMQFTGRKDKNELEVYDNDVIRIISTISGEYDISKVDTIKQVIWRDEMVAYCLETKSERQHYEDGYNVYKYARSENRVTHMFLDQVENFEVEVIGNIYSNPDLLP